MFGKSKVKGHNRVSKSKSGFKVIRVNDFFRKKDENRAKKIALGVGAGLLVAGGTALLLKKKGVKLPTNIGKEAKDLVVDVKTTRVPEAKLLTQATKKIEEVVPDNKLITSGTKKVQVDDPWETPILTKIQKNNATVNLMTSSSTNIPLLTGKKIPAQRSNLLVQDTRFSKRVTKKASSDAVRIGEMEKVYKSMSEDSLPMKIAVKLDHYLKRPRKTSSLGRPPKKTSLKEVLETPNLKKAEEKVRDRLSRAERNIAQKKSKLVKKN